MWCGAELWFNTPSHSAASASSLWVFPSFSFSTAVFLYASPARMMLSCIYLPSFGVCSSFFGWAVPSVPPPSPCPRLCPLCPAAASCFHSGIWRFGSYYRCLAGYGEPSQKDSGPFLLICQMNRSDSGFGARSGWRPCRCWWSQNNHRRVYRGPLRAAALQPHRQQACSHTLTMGWRGTLARTSQGLEMWTWSSGVQRLLHVSHRTVQRRTDLVKNQP